MKAQYAAGPSFVIHKSSARLDRSECDRALAYIDNTLATSRDADLLAFNRQCREQLVSAMAASFPQQIKDAAE